VKEQTPKLEAKYRELKQKVAQLRDVSAETDALAKEGQLKQRVEELQREKKTEEQKRRKQVADIEAQIKLTEESNAATAEQMRQMDHELKMKDLQIRDIRRKLKQMQIRVTGGNSQPNLEMSPEVPAVKSVVPR
jgi:hypothetical protein